MRWTSLKKPLRAAGTGATIVIAALSLGSASHADSPPRRIQASSGTAEKGFLTYPLYRGAAVPDEFTVVATPNNCMGSIQVTYTWNETENWVRLHLYGKGVLQPYPSIRRTEGVDYFTNPFWPERKDFDNGRYQFWTIVAADVATFYYSAETLSLLGSQYDFATPPTNSIPVRLPVFAAVPTPFFEPDANGDVDLTVEYQYDHLVRPDLPQFAHTFGSFIPHSLCTTNPFRYDQTSTRPYAITVDESYSKSFREFLENGLVFDMTIEPPEYYTFPPLTTMAGVYSGATAIAGGIPQGWTLDIEAVFGSLAPPIRQLPSAPGEGGECVDWFKPKRDRNFNVCSPMP